MADVQPLKTLRYDPDVAGPLEDLIAPPYDVIDDEGRAELAARSPNNVVELDLPPSYEAAARDPGRVAPERGSRPGGRARHLGAAAGLHRAGRQHPLAHRVLRTRARGGLRRGPDPPARAHPSGPEGGPAQAHARDAREPLPHLQPLPRSPAAPPPRRSRRRCAASRSPRRPTARARATPSGAWPTPSRSRRSRPRSRMPSC